MIDAATLSVATITTTTTDAQLSQLQQMHSHHDYDKCTAMTTTSTSHLTTNTTTFPTSFPTIKAKYRCYEYIDLCVTSTTMIISESLRTVKHPCTIFHGSVGSTRIHSILNKQGVFTLFDADSSSTTSFQ